MKMNEKLLLCYFGVIMKKKDIINRNYILELSKTFEMTENMEREKEKHYILLIIDVCVEELSPFCL